MGELGRKSEIRRENAGFHPGISRHRPSEEELSLEVLRCLRRLTHAMDQHSSALARRFGLTGPQLALLRTLERSGEQSASMVARRLSLSQPTVTGIVKRLLDKGLISRRPSQEDRRVALLRLTALGEKVLGQAPPLLREPFQAALTAMAPQEQTELLTWLQKIVALIEQPPFPGSGNESPLSAAGGEAAGPSPSPAPESPAAEGR